MGRWKHGLEGEPRQKYRRRDKDRVGFAVHVAGDEAREDRSGGRRQWEYCARDVNGDVGVCEAEWVGGD